ncbi:hypothetical protein ABB37_05387 [Leptomonas pyrrhocoris]|uniref:Uncharacterized protein n=1 Tax=Leptomonas pyrrhocoris TaxID=157538 RepID=A0A0M9FZY8_LEPPY|nr:hypothetical protein ABB37_05387 [Leptomonas pyrrhocoris]XP_015658019.1 hypothetical protein ABB37_05387 [Leptomonas pyrrhocoris]KPA79579.1 hypothetical protein ABB37_05387 [Leptomonas pyrrhocoris]KPA79580.1 hypothetical protein ABB37_05387 [Leptomonas pyrrhocoris]|eukprot:XP_015658018.1 hypothetical protein ABB37_05387 [Leptomonas pyrrhocoris]
MPPKKKRTAAAAKAPAMTNKTPSASSTKPTSSSPSPPSSPPPAREASSLLNPASQNGSTSPSAKQDGRRSQSGGEHAITPKRASASQPQPQPQPLRTPERQGSHGHLSALRPQRSRDRDNAASPSVPPAPATTPVPAAERTPRREGSNGRDHQRNSRKSTGLSLSASPVPPPPPPTTPVPAAKRASSSSQKQQQQQRTPSRKRKDRTASAQGRMSPETKKRLMTTSSGDPAATAATTANTTTTSKPPKKNDNVKGSLEGSGGSEQTTKKHKPLSRSVRRYRSRHSENASPLSSPLSHSVQSVIRESKVIAPDVSGIRCLAIHPSEQHVVVARENGSLVLYDVSFFQNIPQFVQRRHTGGQTRRTITSLAYVAVPAPTSASTTSSSTTTAATTAPAASTRYVLLASMMSGQVVIYDAELLVPLALHQRSGGAIWQMTAASPACIYAAMADSSWQQLRLTCKRDGAAPQLDLVRVVPGISGADRALTVATSASLSMAVGTDDVGNVHAWRLPAANDVNDDDADDDTPAARSRGLAEHESLWTTRLAKGVALSCAVVGGTRRPCVVVGTSMGDVVLLDAAHGHVFQTFSQHKGPVTTLVVQNDAVVFASGWHESLRSYRCSGEGDWHPAEVKRRTHYHEASQLALMPGRQLILSASRDGTVLYAPTAQLFHTPAMYVVVTTQQFAYAAGRGVLLQSRFDTVEAFCMDEADRHWVPLFGHRLEGRFHLSGLWCDEQLRYILFSTEERLGLLKVGWRAQAAMAIVRIEEVLELPARTGVVDVCWGGPAPRNSSEVKDQDDEEVAAADASTSATAAAPQVLYILYDDCITSVTLAEGYPVVNTAVLVKGKGLPADSLRPYRVFSRHISVKPGKAQNSSGEVATRELVIYGHRGSCRLPLLADGTPEAEKLVADLDDVYELVQEVPVLAKQRQSSDGDGDRPVKKAKGEAADTEAAAASESSTVTTAVALTPSALVGLSATQERYIVGATLHSSAAGAVPLPATLPHDVKWIARLPASSASAYTYLGYFSRGLLVATGDTWHMLRRMNVEAAFVVRGGTEVLVLERNLEKTLESLPLTWKVRRFGN